MPITYTDTFTGIGATPKTVSAESCALVSPSDTDDLTYAARGISFATAGALKVTLIGGTTIVIPSGALAAGIIHPLRATRIWNTSTTAASIVAYW